MAFGDPDNAVVGTLGLNPSWREFQSASGVWLHGTERRLASLISLGVDDPQELDDDHVAQVVAESNAYFRGPNWYRDWFRWLESLLRGSGAGSYLDGSACHLDLVQWATKPSQGDLPTGLWDRLVEQDRAFLRWQLRNSNVRVLLLDGASVVRWVKRAGLVAAFERDVLVHQGANGNARIIRVFRATAEGVVFLGWNRPVAGALASDGRQRLVRWVAQALQGFVSAARPPTEEPSADWEGSVSAPVDLEDGFIPDGTIVDGPEELERLLSYWTQVSDTPTICKKGTYGGRPGIIVRMGTDTFGLHRDTRPDGVRRFLETAARAGGADNLRWHVTANRDGRINRVSYRPDDEPTPGWFAYLQPPSSESPAPRDLR